MEENEKLEDVNNKETEKICPNSDNINSDMLYPCCIGPGASLFFYFEEILNSS